MKKLSAVTCLALAALAAPNLRAAGDLLIADFEAPDYGLWKTTGEAFGPGPARGTLPGQIKVEGFLGKGFTGVDIHKDRVVNFVIRERLGRVFQV